MKTHYVDRSYDDRVQYFELDQELYCLRSILVEADIYLTSNMLVEDYILPEGSFLDVLEHLKAIEESEFNRIWNHALDKYRQQWIRAKEMIRPGHAVDAAIICFYPQGVIMDIGTKFVGLLSMDDCRTVFTEKEQYPGSSTKLRVKGYVEEQLWFNLVGKKD